MYKPDATEYVRWRSGVEADLEGRAVTLTPVVRVTQNDPGHLLRSAVLHHLRVLRGLEEGWVVVHVRHLHLQHHTSGQTRSPQTFTESR